MPADDTGHAGEVGPEIYAKWRSTGLGLITEELEQRLILEFAAPVRGERILDIGCGDGALTLALWKKGASLVVGCDSDTRMIAAAKGLAASHGANIGYAIGRAEQLPFADETFDVLTAVTVLCFFPEPSSAVREMARVLRPGGRLVIGDLGKWSLWAGSRRIRGWLGSDIWRAARFRTAGELCALAEQAKLRVEMIRGAVYYPPVEFLARLMAPADPLLGRLTGLGAAFLAMRATRVPDK